MSTPAKAIASNFTAPPSVASQIARLPELPMPEIKALWQRLFGDDTPTHNRQFLERRIAYRLQEVEFRKTDGNLLLLKTEMGAGHGGMCGRYQGLKDVALEYAFVFKVLSL